MTVVIKDSSVSKVAGWLAAGSTTGFQFPALFATISRPAMGTTQPPCLWVPGLKRSECEDDLSPLPSAEVEDCVTYVYFSPHLRLCGWCLGTGTILPFLSLV